MHNYMDLTGRVALITGASSGIGAATAVMMADLGATVAMGYHANEGGAAATRDRIVAAGGRAVTVRADVRTADAVRAMVDQVTRELGPIDILVNNAGSLVERFSVREVNEARLDEIFTLNFKSAVMASQAVAPSMIERRRGAIVNIVSIAGQTGGGPRAGIYASAKAALACYTKALARELAPFGVRANAVAPGVIDTDMSAFVRSADGEAFALGKQALKRVGKSDDIADVVSFLAGPKARWVTGQVIEATGGSALTF